MSAISFFDQNGHAKQIKPGDLVFFFLSQERFIIMMLQKAEGSILKIYTKQKLKSFILFPFSSPFVSYKKKIEKSLQYSLVPLDDQIKNGEMLVYLKTLIPSQRSLIDVEIKRFQIQTPLL